MMSNDGASTLFTYFTYPYRTFAARSAESSARNRNARRRFGNALPLSDRGPLRRHQERSATSEVARTLLSCVQCFGAPPGALLWGVPPRP